MDNQTDPEADPTPRPVASPAAGRIFDPSCLVGPLSAIGCVVVALAFCSVLIRSYRPGVPRGMDPADPTMSNAGLVQAASKVATLIRQGWAERGRTAPGLGLLIGDSSTAIGFDTAVLEADSPVPMRWMNLAFPGANAEDVYRIARLVLRSGIRPNVIVFGFHQQMLPQTDNFQADKTAFRIDDLRLDLSKGRVRAVLKDVRDLSIAGMNRAFPRRTYTNYLFREVAIEAKIRAFRRLGIGVDGLFAADSEAWKSPPGAKRKKGVENVELTVMPDEAYEYARGKGWFTDENYWVENSNPQACFRLMDECVRDGIRLVIVVIPQLDGERKMFPARSFACLNQILEGRGGRRPEVLDLRTAIREPHFSDLFHVDDVGRDESSRRLAAFLKASPGRSREGRKVRP